jgi:RNA polymerase sigma factor (sigma-70 family)
MVLTPKQQRIVEENMGLVGKVIKDKVHGVGQQGVFTYEELFQIGCIGLCKAAATDKGGCFSTYAYRLIWNEICNALVKSTRINEYEMTLEADKILRGVREQQPDPLEACKLKQILEAAKSSADTVTGKGIACLLLSIQGYTSDELSTIFDAKAPTVRMWMTKARRYLKDYPELVSYVGRQA